MLLFLYLTMMARMRVLHLATRVVGVVMNSVAP
jgi:hypothetical protein